LGGKTLGYSITITGTARAGDAPGATFDHYVLEYGVGSSPSSWTQIGVTGTVPVTDGVLGVWDTTLVLDDVYTLRLRVSDGVGHTSSHQHIFQIDNLTFTNLEDGAMVNKRVPLTITGNAWSTDFQDYVIEYGQGANPSSWTVIATSTVPVTDSVLAVGDLSAIVEADDYTIRLTRHGTLLDDVEQATVYIDPLWQVGWPQRGVYRMAAPTVSIGDLDDDGDLEMVAPMIEELHGASAIFVWQHDGTGANGSVFPTSSEWMSAIALADLDGDSDLEMVVGTSDQKVYVLYPDGQVLNGWPQPVEGGIFGAPAVADLDGGGDLEVVIATEGGYVYAWHYDGSVVAGWPQETFRALYGSPALGDLDGDGDLEVVTACRKKVYAWHHDGTPLLGWPVTETAIMSDVVGSPALGDIDGNGDVEIVLAAGEQVYAWHHNGTAVSNWPQSISGEVQSSPALGDLDGDGDLEVVVGSDQVYAWHGNGNPVSGWPNPVDAHTNSSPVLGDITGDGLADVVIGAGNEDAHVYAWKGDGSAIVGWPRFVSAVAIGGDRIQTRLTSPIIIDLDQDGDVEVVIGAEGYMFVFDLSVAYDSGAMEWPIFQNGVHFTGVYTMAKTFIFVPLLQNGSSSP
jgi:hypothetical protein